MMYPNWILDEVAYDLLHLKFSKDGNFTTFLGLCLLSFLEFKIFIYSSMKCK